MANWDNLTTKLEQENQQKSLENGIIDGMEFVGYPLPEFAYKKAMLLTPYERGFLAAWWLQGWLNPVTA